jgi:uncharacterized SAM-binding protein YcdF (DUF218 family)
MGAVFFLMAASAVGVFLGRKRFAWSCGIMSAALLWFFGCPITIALIGRPLERGYDRAGLAHCDVSWAPQGDAIVILGGGMTFHERCGASEMCPAADRVWTGARLYKLGKAPKIVCTGSDIDKSTLPLLLDFGVPREAVHWYEEARNTEEEARLIKKAVADGRAKPKILLVTSAWHMNRAKFLFEKAGLEVVPCPGDFEMSCSSERKFEFRNLFPDACSFLSNTAAVREWVGIWAYRILKGR